MLLKQTCVQGELSTLVMHVHWTYHLLFPSCMGLTCILISNPIREMKTDCCCSYCSHLLLNLHFHWSGLVTAVYLCCRGTVAGLHLLYLFCNMNLVISWVSSSFHHQELMPDFFCFIPHFFCVGNLSGHAMWVLLFESSSNWQSTLKMNVGVCLESW